MSYTYRYIHIHIYVYVCVCMRISLHVFIYIYIYMRIQIINIIIYINKKQMSAEFYISVYIRLSIETFKQQLYKGTYACACLSYQKKNF